MECNERSIECDPMKFVAYYRVSTAEQGRSGLGLDAQKAAVRAYLDCKGWPPVAEFVEVESGKHEARPELAKALAACRAFKAVLVIAKLDRLARNVAFISRLMADGVEFVACDMPAANRLTVHILAAVAEAEREMISARTKAALAAAKARGTRLGGFRGRAGTAADLSRARAARTRDAGDRARDVLPIIDALRAQGVMSAKAIARALTSRGVPTAAGGTTWQATQVARVLARCGTVTHPARDRLNDR